MDYAFYNKRKSKNDKKAKARFNKYKKGGKYRSMILATEKKEL